jgi:hypothetical protein
MSVLSSTRHRRPIATDERRGMLVDDHVLPAAAHLTGPGAHHVLEAAVAAAGGRLQSARACHLQYRPGHDVVVRFDGRVRWAGGAPVEETLLAATTTSGPPPGTLPVEAATPDGATLAVGVWRWPYDPLVTGLRDAVTPSSCATFLAGLVAGPVGLEVVAYRPTQRAVVRVHGADGVVYVKVLPPDQVGALVDRHERCRAAGLPVPTILRHDPERGLVAMAELAGATIRERLRSGRGPLPAPDQYEALFAGFAAAERGGPLLPGRAATGVRHAAMLASVLPSERGRLADLSGHLEAAAGRAAERSGPTIHGDLYEAQLVTGRGHRAGVITGVLDLDDAGRGDPLDDRATVIAHLVERALETGGASGSRVARYARELRAAFAAHVDPVELDLVVAGALTGLATGPFRLQRPRWARAVRRRLTIAARLASSPGERTLRIGS